MRNCRVEAWTSPPQSGLIGGDVAGLVLVGEGLPIGAGPARLADRASLRGVEVDVFGYPGDPPRRHGAWAILRLRGIVGGGVSQLDADSESAIRAQPGYSGSPVVISDEAGDAVTGMLTVASAYEGTRDAYATLVTRLVGAWPGVLTNRIIPPCPYRGLQAFTANDAQAGLFVGREKEISQLRRMVERRTLIVVLGPSGVGKSSLVAAGLLPALERDGWTTVSVRPGRTPVAALAKALLDVEQPGRAPTMDDLTKRADLLRSDGLASLGAQLKLLTGKPILLCVDQLEEILDPDTCPAERRMEFLELVLPAQAAPDNGLHLVCILRADYLGQLLEHPDAGAGLRDGLFTLSPMGQEELKRVISEPAKACGVEYEKGLVQLIARHASGGGGLPLLEFALTELWSHQSQRWISFPDYQGIEGVIGSLSRHAEQAFTELAAEFSEKQVRRAMLALVRSRGGAAEATRRVVSRERLGSGWKVAEGLAERRLVVLGYDFATSMDTAELAHEALIQAWPRLASWVDDDADFQHWLATMEERAAESDLLSDTRIGEADRWLAERPDDIPREVKLLIEDSKSVWHRQMAELEDARKRALDAARQAEARRLAAAAELALASPGAAHQAAIALAIESLRLVPTIEGDIAARHAIRTAPIQRSRLEHDGPVRSVAFSPDGTKIATGSEDGTARVFDAAASGELCRLNHDGPVRSVAFSPDGTKIATGSEDGTARVFDAAASGELCRLNHDGPVRSVAFSPDGTKIATGSEDGTARVFDAAASGELCRLNHDGPVRSVAFSPDGTKVATGSGQLLSAMGSARVFDAATGAELCRLDHDGSVRSVAFSPNGTKVVTGSNDRSARVFDAATGAELCRLDHDGWVRSVAFSPNGTKVATGSEDGSARVLDTETHVLLCQLRHGDWLLAVAFGADGAKVATGSADGSARVLDAVTGAQLCRLDHGGPVNAVAFSPNGARVATGSDDGSARVLNAVTGAHLSRLDYGGRVRSVAFSPDGMRVATGSDDGSARILDAVTGTQLLRLDHRDWVRAVAFSPNGTKVATGSDDGSTQVFDAFTAAQLCHLYCDSPVNAIVFSTDGTKVATASRDGTARVFEAATGAEVCRLDHDGGVWAVMFSPDGTKVATASRDGTARVFEAATGAEACRLDHDGGVRSATFTPDGTKVATASDDGTARVFEAATGTEVCRLDHDGGVWAVMFSPDGTKVATASDDGTARVFEAATGTEVCRLDHDGGVWAVMFSPDGTKVATASDDGTARVFEAATGTEVCRLDHDGGVWAVMFSPDGTKVATASYDGSARVWIVGPLEFTRHAADRLTRNLTEREWRRYLHGEPYRKTRADLP